MGLGRNHTQLRSFPIELAMDDTGPQQSLSDLAAQLPEVRRIGGSSEKKSVFILSGSYLKHSGKPLHIERSTT